MHRRWLIRALAIFAASPAFAAPKLLADTPATAVRDLYVELPRPVSMRRLSPKLRLLLRADQARAERNLDFEWRSGGQERPAITDLRIRTTRIGKERAEVEAGFFNLGERRLRRYAMLRDHGRWLVDEVAMIPENETLSSVLKGPGVARGRR